MDDSSSILAIETATPIGSVALLHGGKLSEFSFGEPHRQAAQLLPMIEQLLEDANISYADLDTLAVTVGPGSFTGIRIGLATARTIAMSYPNLPLYPFTTLECLASSHISAGKSVLATLNAGKGQIYVQSFAEDSTADEHRLVDPYVLLNEGHKTIVGNSGELLPDQLKDKLVEPKLPSASSMLIAIQSGFAPEKRDMSPLYIRKPDAELSNKPLL